MAEARAELGYVDFLRARYDRAEVWLTEALEFADGSPAMHGQGHDLPRLGGKRPGQLPAALSARWNRRHAARAAGDPRRAAFASSMLGRHAPAAR